MSQFDALSPEDQERLISLPYRVGMFVSHADDEGGEEDDVREEKALERILTSLATTHEKSPFVREVLQKTLENKAQWPVWGEWTFNVTDDAEKVMQILKGSVSETDWKTYRGLLVHIGSTVAEAYGEFGEFDDGGEGGLFGKLVSKITDKMSGADEESHMNISAAEDSALSALAAALRAGSE